MKTGAAVNVCFNGYNALAHLPAVLAAVALSQTLQQELPLKHLLLYKALVSINDVI